VCKSPKGDQRECESANLTKPMKENKKVFAGEQQFSCPPDKSNKKQQGDKKRCSCHQSPLFPHFS